MSELETMANEVAVEELQVNPQMALSTTAAAIMDGETREDYLVLFPPGATQTAPVLKDLDCTTAAVPSTLSLATQSITVSNTVNAISAPGAAPLQEELFSIGLVIYDTHFSDFAIAAIRNPVSRCQVKALVVLNASARTFSTLSLDDASLISTFPTVNLAKDEQENRALSWLEDHRVLNADQVTLLYGEDGFEQLLKTTKESNEEEDSTLASNPVPYVDALYVIVPTEHQSDYVLRALASSKHVLVKDPVSTSLQDFLDQLAYAIQYSKFLQFSTMFVHHHRVKSFLDCVLYEKTFGSIETINAMITLNFTDVEKVGVKFPLKPGHGCIRRLGRYCILLSSLLLTRAGSSPVSAQVKKISMYPTSTNSSQSLLHEGGCNATTADEKQPQVFHTQDTAMSADCVVRFTNNQLLTFSVSYSPTAPTRQVLEVRARDRYATMTDFVIPHPDGLATYRIYDKERNMHTGKLDVVRGEALDVPSGPRQDVMMWRRFTEFSKAVDEMGWRANASSTSRASDTEPCNYVNSDNDNSSQVLLSTQARELAYVSLQTKHILMALEKSIQRGLQEIPIAIDDSVLQT